MSEVPTGFGGTVSAGAAVVVVAVTSSLLMLSFLLILGHELTTSLVEVSFGGIIVGLAYYLGLRVQS